MSLAQLLCDLGQVTSLGLSFFTYKVWGAGGTKGCYMFAKGKP